MTRLRRLPLYLYTLLVCLQTRRLSSSPPLIDRGENSENSCVIRIKIIRKCCYNTCNIIEIYVNLASINSLSPTKVWLSQKLVRIYLT